MTAAPLDAAAADALEALRIKIITTTVVTITVVTTPNAKIPPTDATTAITIMDVVDEDPELEVPLFEELEFELDVELLLEVELELDPELELPPPLLAVGTEKIGEKAILLFV